MVDIPHSPELMMYADDADVLFPSDSLISLEVSVKNHLSHLSGWLRQNELRLNAKKRTPMIFRPIKKPISNITVKVEGNSIAYVGEQKFLGVWFQEEINWNTHVNHLITALAKIVGCFFRTMHVNPLRLKISMH